jgi:hypothetical protein
VRTQKAAEQAKISGLEQGHIHGKEAICKDERDHEPDKIAPGLHPGLEKVELANIGFPPCRYAENEDK